MSQEIKNDGIKINLKLSSPSLNILILSLIQLTDVIACLTGSTGGGDTASLGRGAMRGRRTLPADLITRPRELVQKQGE